MNRREIEGFIEESNRVPSGRMFDTDGNPTSANTEARRAANFMGYTRNQLSWFVRNVRIDMPNLARNRNSSYIGGLIERAKAMGVPAPPGKGSWTDIAENRVAKGNVVAQAISNRRDAAKFVLFFIPTLKIATDYLASNGVRVAFERGVDSLERVVATVREFGLDIDVGEALTELGKYFIFNLASALIPGNGLRKIIQTLTNINEARALVEAYAVAFPEVPQIRLVSKFLNDHWIDLSTENGRREALGKINEFFDAAGNSVSRFTDTDRRARCFLAGTMIALPDGGAKPIEDIAVGDYVLAFDPNEMEGFGPLVPARVVQLFRNTADDVVVLNEKLRVTLNHEVLTQSGDFVFVSEIEENALVGINGEAIRIRSTRRLEGEYPVFNFEVEELHTYVADGFRVHNVSEVKVVDGTMPSVEIRHQTPDGHLTLRIADGVLIRRLELSNDRVLESRRRLTAEELAEIHTLYLANDGEIDGVDAEHLIVTFASDFEFFETPANAEGLRTIQKAGEVGRSFGAQLGALVQLDNPFADIALDSVLETGTHTIPALIVYDGVDGPWAASMRQTWR